ncbi:Peptide deformylase [Caldalkalibacillus thermarum TA2.A1]|uniref:Peptide deformylase n=1 Tax=Caldalkalibacillus thermarum (strain TA2.A1) TaxID=986075 RepID=F5L7U8_CALTT|nr:peptide deformylase [Caldalkalibacillus thermarum]EGL82607.1 Peptide deformylase [Caldalkalibacillus thermarum TA2.A1]QZT32799.1 peptide deformylase [Caldalkalibacillus thermarum TA2.A1]
MGVRAIVKYPDPVLREKAVEVKRIDERLHRLLNDMAETMYAAEGVGLAAPQVGISKRVFVVDVGDENGLLEFINPEIIVKEGEQIGPEGCLSIPGVNGEVRRAQKIKVRAIDRNGETFELEAEDLLARAIQHELDHLNGVLFIDIAERIYDKENEQSSS